MFLGGAGAGADTLKFRFWYFGANLTLIGSEVTRFWLIINRKIEF